MNPFFYELPSERIAQRPVHPPHDAKLLVVDRRSGSLASTSFLNITDYLQPSDIIVFNDTRVIPARFFGKFEDSPGEVEILLVENMGESRWRCIGRPLRRFREGRVIELGKGLFARMCRRVGEKLVEIEFFSVGQEAPELLMKELGLMPIPPYIRSGRSDARDRLDYQTIFARDDGSVAAPTASLHFTDVLIGKLREETGCSIEFLTLHVGTASFLPLDVQEGSFVPPGSERYLVPSALAAKARKKGEGQRVIAVGTTVVRALESACRQSGETSETSLFIQPGFRFEAVDCLVTNFHQPGTTHLLLLEAFMGRELLKRSYEYALESGYRFLSYGDGMIVI